MSEADLQAELLRLTKKLNDKTATVADAFRCDEVRGAIAAIKRAKRGAAV